MPGSRKRFAVRVATTLIIVLSGTAAPAQFSTLSSASAAVPAGWNVLSSPIDSRQQSAVPWGTRSDWVQPWRSYMDTRPASIMRDALGINFNVDPWLAAPTAQFLAGVGFTRARFVIDWSAMSYAKPGLLQDPGRWDTILGTLHTNRIRPLILLNANDSMPGPRRTFTAQITQSAVSGARTVQIDPASAHSSSPGLSGFDVPGDLRRFIAPPSRRAGR